AAPVDDPPSLAFRAPVPFSGSPARSGRRGPRRPAGWIATIPIATRPMEALHARVSVRSAGPGNGALSHPAVEHRSRSRLFRPRHALVASAARPVLPGFPHGHVRHAGVAVRVPE